MDFAANYARALRYSGTGAWELMRKRLESEPSLRWGTHPESAEFRPIAADAYQDQTGDEEGAAKLRNPSEHVVVDGDGRVKRGGWSLNPVIEAYRSLDDALQTHHNRTLDDTVYGIPHNTHNFGDPVLSIYRHGHAGPTEEVSLPAAQMMFADETERDVNYFISRPHQAVKDALHALRTAPVEEVHPNQK